MSDKAARCCGISFRDSPTTILHSLLIQLPLVYLLALVKFAAFPLRLIFRRSGQASILHSLLESQYTQIREASLAPRWRCVLATKFYHVSPRLSGVVFRLFNFLMLTACWCAAAVLAVLAARWV